MIRFFQTPQKTVIATETDHNLSEQEIKELNWLYGEATMLDADKLDGYFVGPRREMVTPWSTNAVEITQNMGIQGISRIEEYFPVDNKDAEYDEMLQRMYNGINQDIFTINIQPEPIKYVDNLEEYNEQEGLALSPEEIDYLHGLEKQNGRPSRRPPRRTPTRFSRPIRTMWLLHRDLSLSSLPRRIRAPATSSGSRISRV